MKASEWNMAVGKTGGVSWIGRLVPLAILAAGFVLFFVLGLQDQLTFDALGRNRAALLDWVGHHAVLAPAAFAATYAVVIAFSLPVGLLLTITAGFLFGPVLGAAVAVAGGTVGAVAVFLAARTALGDVLRAKAGTAVERMAKGFEEDAFHYLLVLRLVPLFPFWLVNIVPAFTGVPLRTYVAATVLGIIPGTFVSALVGNGLGVVFDAGQTPDLGLLFRPAILAPIFGLAVLALVPVVYKRLRRRRV